MEYRVYLAAADNRFRAFSVFAAENDDEAEETALGVYANCSTSFRAIELWCGTKLVMRQTREQLWPTLDLRELMDRRQESVVQLEETLERGFQCVRESTQLMAALDKVRTG
jgi:hypothetical protein